MANLYVWFPSSEERRAFVLEMLEIGEIVPRNQSKIAQKEAQRQREDLAIHLASLDEGKTKSFYYGLQRQYYMGRIPEHEQKRFPMPWQAPAVYTKGFRQIYTQKTYEHRPGHWLVLDFRQSQAGRTMRQWVESRIPQHRIGTNVPIPGRTKSRWRLEHLQWLLDRPERAAGSLDDLKAELATIQTEYPELFQGDTVYLWERLAFLYFSQDDLGQATFCLRRQAQLQPSSSEAFLNLGSFYLTAGEFHKAAEVFKEGLRIEPDDEYLSFNLAVAYGSLGSPKKARQAANDAILKNPQRGLNHKQKADIHRDQGEWGQALAHYEYAVELIDDSDWYGVKAECYDDIACILQHLGRRAEALQARQQAASCRSRES